VRSRRTMLLTGAAVLIGLAWAQVGLDAARGRLRIVRWQSEPIWQQQEEGDVWWLGIARGGQRGDPVVVVQREKTLHVLGLDGTVRTQGTVPFGTQTTLGDLENDGRDEILIGAEMDESEEPSVQAINHAIEALGPSVQFHDMRNLSSLLALDLDGDGSREVALGDFRGCVSTMAYPNFLWDDCPPGELQSGDPFAARPIGALQDHKLYRLVVARANGGVRVPAGNGKVLWTYEVPGGINAMVTGDLDRDGRGEVVLASPSGQVTVLDTDGRKRWAEDLGEPARSLELLEWDGDRDSLEIAAGGDEGRVAIFAADGHRLSLWDDIDGQAIDLQRVDPDGDGREALVAALGSYQLVILRPDGPRIWTKVPEAPFHLAAREDLLVISGGAVVRAYRMGERSAPGWYNGPVAALLFTLVIAAVWWPLLRLHS
jgi:outer membrane protein assembly factor BamB